MIARVRKSLDENQKGFTLVELLVVIIIIGILSAIAIPLYLNQQKKAQDASAKSDLANLRVAVAQALTENPSEGVGWPLTDATAAGSEVIFTVGGTATPAYTAAVSKGNILSAGTIAADAVSYTLEITSATKTKFETNQTGNVKETTP